jgi:chemotaxis protein CheD
MWTNSSSSDPAEHTTESVRVGVGDLAVTDGATLTSSGLGSCVGIAVYVDGASLVAGLLHAMLPAADEATQGRFDMPAKYVDAGLEALVTRLEDAGADRSRLVAKVAGGSEMLDVAVTEPVGRRNVDAARDCLSRLSVPVQAEDVGGDYGRSLEFAPSTGTLRVTNADGDTVRL